MNDKIQRRGKFMVAMLRIATNKNINYSYEEEYGDDWKNWNVSGIYKKLMKEVFLTDKIYYKENSNSNHEDTYKDIYEKIIDTMEENVADKDEWVRKILEQLKKDLGLNP